MNVYTKLSAIQAEIKAPKNLYNSFGRYSYRNAEGICEALKPFEKAYGVSVVLSDDIFPAGNRVYVRATATIIDCDTGESHSVTAFAREPETKKGMDDSQITGTASSYARKYALNGLLLLDDTKDADTDEYHKQTTETKQPQNPAVDEAETRMQITKLCNQYNINPEKLCKKYGAGSIGELTAEKGLECLAYIKRNLPKGA